MKTTTTRSRQRTAWLILGLLIALLFLFFASFCLGRYAVPASEVIRILFYHLGKSLASLVSLIPGVEIDNLFPIVPTWASQLDKIVIHIRLPRIIMACLVGCCLSAAGASYQGVFQNPMAAPDLLGASSGAAFGAALAILSRANNQMITVYAFAFSLLTVLLVYVIGVRAPGKQALNLILAGIMISSLFTSATSYIKLVADPGDQLPAITYWLMGSLSGAQLKDISYVILPMALGLVPLLLLRWKINLLTLGDDEARAMGVHTNRLRLTVVLCSTLITAAAISTSGMIGWVGLVVPHLCRRIAGSNYKTLMPTTMLLGSIFLLAVDNFSRNLTATEIPIGILTAFIGAPFFLYLMMRKGGQFG